MIMQDIARYYCELCGDLLGEPLPETILVPCPPDVEGRIARVCNECYPEAIELIAVNHPDFVKIPAPSLN